MSLEKVVYTARAKATGGRDGRATSSDGVLDVKLGVPKEMGGAGGEVTNPEAAVCLGLFGLFLGAMKLWLTATKSPCRRTLLSKGKWVSAQALRSEASSLIPANLTGRLRASFRN